MGPLCLCGKRGCVERLASAVREELRDRPCEGKILRSLANHSEEAITAQFVSLAAAEGDAIAIEALDRAAWALGVGIGNAANLINPQRFVLGGGFLDRRFILY